MLVDEAEIEVHGGRGGNGCVSFRREAYVPRGGPDGGDGGKGGDVILAVAPHLTTLLDFQYKSHYKARNGEHGQGSHKSGKSGKDLVIKVPPGTVVYDAETGQQVADLTRPGQKLTAARGGDGGRGNARFATSTRRTPRFAEMGQNGERHRLRLELRLLADVGIIGFPNVGKSTLISVVSAAKPRIASYPFTTLAPNLGVVKVDDGVSYVLADMPGLIEGAAEGAGLGHQFLRHVQRTRLVIHMLDVAGIEGRDPLEDFKALNAELAQFDARLTSLPQIVALNKIDLPQAADNLERCQAFFERERLACFPISAATTQGVQELMRYVTARLLELLPKEPYARAGAAEKVFTMPERPARPLTVQKAAEGVFIVRGSEVEEMVTRTNLDSEAGVAWLHERLEKAGILQRLEDVGANEGDTVIIGDTELEYSTQGKPQ